MPRPRPCTAGTSANGWPPSTGGRWRWTRPSARCCCGTRPTVRTRRWILASKRGHSDSFACLARTEPMNIAAEMQWQLTPPRSYADGRVVIHAAMEPVKRGMPWANDAVPPRKAAIWVPVCGARRTKPPTRTRPGFAPAGTGNRGHEAGPAAAAAGPRGTLTRPFSCSAGGRAWGRGLPRGGEKAPHPALPQWPAPSARRPSAVPGPSSWTARPTPSPPSSCAPPPRGCASSTTIRHFRSGCPCGLWLLRWCGHGPRSSTSAGGIAAASGRKPMSRAQAGANRVFTPISCQSRVQRHSDHCSVICSTRSRMDVHLAGGCRLCDRPGMSRRSAITTEGWPCEILLPLL